MTDIIAPIGAAGIGTVMLVPMPDVEPFSIRSGYSFEGILSDIRVWIRDVLVPYLEDTSPQTIFQQNVDTMTNTVNTALSDQSATVTAALNAAVQEIITASIPVTTELLLESIDPWEILAPAPSGGDDSVTLNTLIAAAAATKGTVRLQRGVYKANLLGPQSPAQATLVGPGVQQCAVQAVSNATPALKLRGGSGPVNGGALEGFRLLPAAGGGGIGLEFSGTTHMRADIDVAVNGSDLFAVGVRFHNEDAGDFTEMVTFEGSIEQAVQPIQYSVTAGNDSFHGSGVSGAVIGTSPASTNAVVTVDDGIGLPYGCPFTAEVFITNPAQRVFHNGNTGNRDATFYGTLTIEGSPSLVADGTVRTLFAGELIAFGGGHGGLGKFFLCDKVNYDPVSGAILAQLKPLQTFNALQPGTTQLTSAGFLIGGEQALVTATVVGPNYQQHLLLSVWQNNQDDTGVVTVLAHPKDFDSAGVGEPVFSWSGNALKVTNANYTASFTASVSIVPLDFGVYGQAALTN